MPFQTHNKQLVLFIFLFAIFFSSAGAADNVFEIKCLEKALPISITGTKTKLAKLKKVISSEAKMFAAMTEEQSLTHLKKILLDTGLFSTVKVEKNAEGVTVATIEDAYTLLPIINFSTNLDNFSYTAGVSESDLFNDMWQVAGAWSQSSSSSSLYYSLGVAYPTDYIQSLNAGGIQGDSYFYYQKKWYQFELDDFFMTIRFKDIINLLKFNYGAQIRYTQFSFLDDPTFSASVFASIGKTYRYHDISEGYHLGLSARYLDDRYNRYTFNASFQKNWYIPIKDNSVFRGYQLDYQIDYSNIEEDRSAVGTIFSFRSGALHGLRSNSVFEENFATTGFRFGVTSQKFLWTYWQPHAFMEAGISDHETYYSVGVGILLTFPSLYNSRIRLQYYHGELPDSLSGVIISTSLDF